MSYNKDISENDYTFVESNLSDFYGVKLKSGEWKDVVITYGKVTIKENKEAAIATLAFSYQINESGKFQPDQLEADENFKNYLGDILSHIINSKDDLEGSSQVEE
jgi:hypothetical protein